MEIRTFQNVIKDTYFEKDKKRGKEATFLYLIEEIGELATALREGSPEELKGEFGDVLAWLTTLANLAEVDLQDAISKYAHACPGCQQVPCQCLDAKP